MLTHAGVFAPLVVNGKYNQTDGAANHKQQNQTPNVSMGVTAKQDSEKGKSREYH